MPTVRPPAVSGLFYPGEANILARDVHDLLAAAHPPALTPKALIVPHAGYVYSGAIAASAYAALKNIAPFVRRVILLGPTHHVAVRGLALPEADRFSTPLGEIEVDTAAAKAIAHLPFVTANREVHRQEHSLEVQLPFLQTVLSNFKLLPLAVGMAEPEEVAEVLDLLWGGTETLIVISSDLSHYLPYGTAVRVDKGTIRSILDLSDTLDHEHACGATPINGLILAARRHHLAPQLLDLRNSGDTAGPRDGVVGYAAVAFIDATATETATAANAESRQKTGEALLKLARASIAGRLGISTPAATDETAKWLSEPGAVFVTLTLGGQLRGCIGSLEAYRPLLEDVRENALAAAFRDPRFPPLTAAEFRHIGVEVSLLSKPAPMQFASEAEALSQLRPFVDGVVFEYGGYRGTFLPQVWEQLPNPAEFMAHLKTKAGLPPDFWSPGVKLSRYTVEKWSE